MRRLPAYLFLVVLLVYVACDAPDTPPVEPTVTEITNDGPLRASDLGKAPDFALPTLEADSLRLSDLKGRIVVLNFWATWCAPCRQEMPELMELQEEFEDRGLSVLGVSMDTRSLFDPDGPKALVSLFAERLAINYPVVMGSPAVAEAYGGVYALPTTFVIDQDGQIAERYIGMVNRDILETALHRLLDK